MAEKLIARNFGPIKEADIEIRDLTVFVGPQATGKSIAAQLLYFMRGIDDLVGRSVETYSHLQERIFQAKESGATYTIDAALSSVVSALEWWLGNDLAVYTQDDTVLSWNPEAPNSETDWGMWWQHGASTLSPALERRIAGGQFFSYAGFYPQLYVPAGRTLYSFLPPASALYFLSRRGTQVEWPGYIATFYEMLGTVIRKRWREQEREQLSFLQESMYSDFVRARINRIIKGEILYGPDTILLRIGDQVLRPETISAGQMEVWPFWTLLEDTLLSDRQEPTRVYFEEPEAHLHPGAQCDLMEMVAYLVRQGSQFLITTHSPYVLYAINNALMAKQVLDTRKELPPSVPAESVLSADQVAAYRFSADGRVYDILDTEVGLIDEDELDRVADDLGAAFTDLQEWLGGAE
jgi:hypothetical protein